MRKTVVSQTIALLRSDLATDDTACGFSFYVVDSSLVGEPEEVASASHHKLKVGITGELTVNWRMGEFSERDLIKVLFHYGKRHIEKRIKEGILQEYEELRLSTEEHPENYCPLDVSRIPDPVGFDFQVDVGDQHSGLESQKSEPAVHPNVIILTNRMNDALARDDRAGVLHASASIFETLAKDIVGISSVQNQTLKSFFDRYRDDSALPNEILDYILAVYDARSVTPLAGHGSTQTPTLSSEAAITLAEITKAFVRIEYSLHQR